MAITNQAKPTSTIGNQTKVNIGEVWDTDLFTWATELRTWDRTQSIINNSARVSSSMANQAKP